MQISPRSAPSSAGISDSSKLVKLETEGAFDEGEEGSVFDEGTIGGDEDALDANGNPINNAELRRQIHIQSEQKRRAQIKDGFEDLRKQLPGCLNKKMSKAALLHRTVQHIQHLKTTQITLLAELERVMAENEQLRNVVVQKQMGYL
jgi:flagellar basal body P-ring protein FlgI